MLVATTVLAAFAGIGDILEHVRRFDCFPSEITYNAMLEIGTKLEHIFATSGSASKAE